MSLQSSASHQYVRRRGRNLPDSVSSSNALRDVIIVMVMPFQLVAVKGHSRDDAVDAKCLKMTNVLVFRPSSDV